MVADGADDGGSVNAVVLEPAVACACTVPVRGAPSSILASVDASIGVRLVVAEQHTANNQADDDQHDQ